MSTFRPRSRSLRAWASTTLAAALLAVACSRDGGTGPREPAGGPARLSLRARVASDGETRVVQIGVGYRRGSGEGGEVRALPTDPASVTVTSGTTKQQPVVVDLVPCFADDERQHGERGGCNLVVELRLTTTEGALIAVSQADVPDVIAGGTAVAPEVALTAPTISVATPTVAFSGTSEFGSPAPAVVQTTTAGSVPVGTLSATIDFGAGPTGWLAATVDQTSGAVTITPTLGTLAPGTYAATVTVGGSTPGVKPQTIAVSFTVRAPAVLTLAGSGSGSGRVTATAYAPQAALDCGVAAGATSGTCTGRYPVDSLVTLVATPTTGSTFTGWAGDCTGTGPCSVTLDRARAVTASFVLQTFGLSVSPGAGTGAGSVTSNVGGITCSFAVSSVAGPCAASYNYGTVVTLTATPQAGSVFNGFTGDCTGTGPCTVTVDRARAVGASFTLTQRTLGITAGTGTGGGAVSSDVGGIACTLAPNATTGTCATTLPFGTVVTLTAAADATSTFDGWTGACTGTGACSVTLDAAKQASALFTLQLRTFTVSAGNGDGSGTVTSTPAGIRCAISGTTSSGQCSTTQVIGSQVTLTPAANSGSLFAGWSGACSGTGACTVTVGAAPSATATFVQATRTLSLTLIGDGTGTVQSSPAGLTCSAGGSGPTQCSGTFPTGTAVTLTATPSAANRFDGFSNACSGNPTCTLTLDVSRSVTGQFTYVNTVSVNVFVSGEGTLVFTPDGGQPPCQSQFSSTSCTRSYNGGTVVTITPQGAPATATQGASTFTGYGSGPCQSAGTGPCTFTANSTNTGASTNFINFSASFQRPPTLSVGVSFGLGTTTGGRVTSQPAGIDCVLGNGDPNTGTCSAAFPVGAVVTLTGSADQAGSQGRAISGCDTANPNGGPCTVTMSYDRSVEIAIDGPPVLSLNFTEVAPPTGWQYQLNLTSDQANYREINLTTPFVTQTSGDGTWTFEAQLQGTRTSTTLLGRCVSHAGFSGATATFEVAVGSSDPGVQPARQTFTCSTPQ